MPSLGVHSSWQIERACEVDIAFRVITANQKPDYSTVCRFRSQNEEEPGMLFTQVLRLCAEAGLVKTGVVALDRTKVKANASTVIITTVTTASTEMAKTFFVISSAIVPVGIVIHCNSCQNCHVPQATG